MQVILDFSRAAFFILGLKTYLQSKFLNKINFRILRKYLSIKLQRNILSGVYRRGNRNGSNVRHNFYNFLHDSGNFCGIIVSLRISTNFKLSSTFTVAALRKKRQNNITSLGSSGSYDMSFTGPTGPIGERKPPMIPRNSSVLVKVCFDYNLPNNLEFFI